MENCLGFSKIPVVVLYSTKSETVFSAQSRRQEKKKHNFQRAVFFPIDRGKKNSTVWLRHPKFHGIYLGTSLSLCIHFVCRETESGNFDRKIRESVFILTFETASGNIAGPFRRGKFLLFSCGRVQKQHDGSEADIKSTEVINQFHTRNLMVLRQISRRQKHHDLTLYQCNKLHTIPGKCPF